MEGFFDEKSGKWIRILKGVIIVEFWLMIVAAVVLCFVGWAEELCWTESAFIDGILALIAGCVGAVIFLVPNMLILQLLNNVQIIREKIETVKFPSNNSYDPKPVSKPKMEIPVNYNENATPSAEATAPAKNANPPSGMISCPSCGKTQYPGKETCFSCGAALK